MLVDDDEATPKLIRMRLADTDKVIETYGSEEGVELALREKPAVILLDCMIPKLSGFELYKTFQSPSQTSFIPILMISGGPEDPKRSTKSTA